MIRTNVVTLTVIPAIAYREKLQDGGSAIVVYRKGETQPGIAGISNKTGEPVPTANTNIKKYPMKAFEEGMHLTKGMSFKKQGAVKITDDMFKKEKPKKEEPEESVNPAETPEYLSILAHYLDKSGNFSYELINRDFIKFVHTSSIVRGMIADQKPAKTIRQYIVVNKFRNISGNDDLSEKMIDEIVKLLDEKSPKGIFKELDDYIRKELGEAKKG